MLKVPHNIPSTSAIRLHLQANRIWLNEGRLPGDRDLEIDEQNREAILSSIKIPEGGLALEPIK